MWARLGVTAIPHEVESATCLCPSLGAKSLLNNDIKKWLGFRCGTRRLTWIIRYLLDLQFREVV